MIDVLTVNEDPKNKEDLMEIIWQALKYFPDGIWGGVQYIGNIEFQHDLEIEFQEESYKALTFKDLFKKIRDFNRKIESKKLLLAITQDPVIDAYYRLEEYSFRRIVYFVYDYVLKNVGLVSLFRVEKKIGIKIAAHGLGHNQDLEHHLKPIDLMYEGLLREPLIEKEGFCDDCKEHLQKRIIT